MSSDTLGRVISRIANAKPDPIASSLRHVKTSPITDDRIKTLAGRALTEPHMLTLDEIRELGGSVMAHIEPRYAKTKS